jgi:hypothetical protein
MQAYFSDKRPIVASRGLSRWFRISGPIFSAGVTDKQHFALASTNLRGHNGRSLIGNVVTSSFGHCSFDDLMAKVAIS